MAIGHDGETVVVTGLGTVNAIAGDPREFAAALRNGGVRDRADFPLRYGGIPHP